MPFRGELGLDISVNMRIVLAAYDVPQNLGNTREAEAAACYQGLRLARDT